MTASATFENYTTLTDVTPLAGVGFNKVNQLASPSRAVREPLLARCDVTMPSVAPPRAIADFW